MCKIYKTIGSLTTLKNHLKENDIHDFRSLKEVMEFQRSFTDLCQDLISKHRIEIEIEKNALPGELERLNSEIENIRKGSEELLKRDLEELRVQLNFCLNASPDGFYGKLSRYFRKKLLERKMRNREAEFYKEEIQFEERLKSNCQNKLERLRFIESDPEEAVRLSAQIALSELERKKAVVDSLNSFIYGALGEQKVFKTLETLSDDYHLINDFSVTFHPAIRNRRENDYIKSIQIDHILVGPSGIFLIETKNWSDKSLESLSLRSPVEQIQRTSFALFRLFNKEIKSSGIRLNNHHWGDKKIPVRNLIVLTNKKPNEEFQYVKVLSVDELLNYIKYFKPVFSGFETHNIADYLLRIDGQREISIR